MDLGFERHIDCLMQEQRKRTYLHARLGRALASGGTSAAYLRHLTQVGNESSTSPMCAQPSTASTLRLTFDYQRKLTYFSICIPSSPYLSLQMMHSLINARLGRETGSCLAQPGHALSSIIRPLSLLPSFSTVLPPTPFLNKITS